MSALPTPDAPIVQPGHAFVVRGDLTKLACDAVVVPTSRALQGRSTGASSYR